jgi:hypothetical protein
MLQRLGLLVSSSRSTVKELAQQFRTSLFLVPLAIGLRMKVRGFQWLGISGTHPAPPSSHWWGAHRQIPSERLQVIYKIAQIIHLRELFPRKFIQTNTRLFRKLLAMHASFGLEGLVSKRRDRPYQAGRWKHWIKVKNRKHPAMSRVMDGAR